MEFMEKCRMCLGPHDCINILSYIDGRTKLSMVLETVTGIRTPEGIPLSRNVCESCFDQARSVHLFQKLCFASMDAILLKSGESGVRCPGKEVSSRCLEKGTQTIDLQPQENAISSQQSHQNDFQEQSEEHILHEINEVVEDDEDEDTSVDECNAGNEVQEEVVVFEADRVQEYTVREEVDEEDNKIDSINSPPDNSDSKKKIHLQTAKLSRTRSSARTQIKSLSTPVYKHHHNFGCGPCKKYFNSLKNLVEHTSTFHEESTGSIRIYMCPTCRKKFDSAANLRSHEVECKDSEPLLKPFSCSICPARFEFQRDLQNHRIVDHDDQKRFSCTVCPMKFTRSSQVTLHMRSHTNEKPHECEHCGACFAKRTNMVRHMKKHQPDGMFVCSVCDKSFKWETSLKVHMNMHSGTRFFCDLCSKDYGSMSGYRKHVLAKHTIKTEKKDITRSMEMEIHSI